MSSRIAKTFERLRAENKKALIAYVTAGDPTPDHTPRIVAALERGGADLIELGVPFSDPIADGPVIQLAAERAIKAGTTVKRVLEMARRIRETSDVPLVLFSYLNPLLRYGFEALARDAADAGIDGCLLTDMSVEEAGKFLDVMRARSLDTVFLASPTSSERRLELVSKYSTGFVYLVSRAGVTGEQASLSASAGPLVAKMRAITSLPLAVGFGISKREHSVEVAKIADAVVVGSTFVRAVEEHAADGTLEQRLESLAHELKP